MADGPPDGEKTFKAVIAGASGATGKYLLENLIKSKSFSEIVSLGRRKLTDVGGGVNVEMEESSGRLKQEIVDMENLSNESVGKHFSGADVYFSCLGTTRKAAGSAEMFKHIDFGYNYNLARVAKENNVHLFSLQSTQGADKDSMFLYLQVKGELEVECGKLNFPSYTVFRPGFMDRGENAKFMEKVAGLFVKLLPTETIARSMLSNALQILTAPPSNTGEHTVYYDDEIRHMSDHYEL
jgi:oxidoreductase